jgi:hypothetical protein
LRNKILLIFFNEKYDFWPVYESIKKYYPIGCILDWEQLHAYRNFDYPGKKMLESLIMENIHDESRYKSHWVAIEKEIEKHTAKEVIGTTYGQSPSFSAYIPIETTTNANMVLIKELYFFQSLLGPYYSVIGVDRTEITTGKQKVYITNYLAASPEDGYADTFRKVDSIISQKLPGYLFTPFALCQQEITGLSVRGASDEHNKKVFHALFNDQIDLDAENIGDTLYGGDKWIRTGFNPSAVGGWVIYS